MTQNELAEKLGISQNRISDMEKGRRPISDLFPSSLCAFACIPSPWDNPPFKPPLSRH
ncbi:helix-turn-helix transcriptional regulator [Desulfosarcina sp. OttesenSCG-928-A07]|nr:helix-turn-helix transcriptional regulator [Desulfosarcina sp. OttesenSCG-928-G17]MDL2329940.1 helix-turn-helix transcriptional regulator [Desulfosarcina sp. OttesenSCG-928-A07]